MLARPQFDSKSWQRYAKVAFIHCCEAPLHVICSLQCPRWWSQKCELKSAVIYTVHITSHTHIYTVYLSTIIYIYVIHAYYICTFDPSTAGSPSFDSKPCKRSILRLQIARRPRIDGPLHQKLQNSWLSEISERGRTKKSDETWWHIILRILRPIWMRFQHYTIYTATLMVSAKKLTCVKFSCARHVQNIFARAMWIEFGAWERQCGPGSRCR